MERVSAFEIPIGFAGMIIGFLVLLYGKPTFSSFLVLLAYPIGLITLMDGLRRKNLKRLIIAVIAVVILLVTALILLPFALLAWIGSEVA